MIETLHLPPLQVKVSFQHHLSHVLSDLLALAWEGKVLGAVLQQLSVRC